jgi:hypothetical protein
VIKAYLYHVITGRSFAVCVSREKTDRNIVGENINITIKNGIYIYIDLYFWSLIVIISK